MAMDDDIDWTEKKACPACSSGNISLFGVGDRTQDSDTVEAPVYRCNECGKVFGVFE